MLLPIIFYLLKYGIFVFVPKKKKEFGLVIDESTKRPISFAIVKVYDENPKLLGLSVTDQKGRYFLDIKPGNYNFEISHPEYFLKKQTTNLLVDFTLTHKSHTETGINISFIDIFSKVVKVLSFVFFIHALIYLIINPVAWNVIIASLYLLSFLIKRRK